MNYPSQEDLLGYVLGALDAQEQRDLQQLIDDNPELEEQLLELKAALTPLDCLESTGPRPGLARRTCEMVANYQTIESHEMPTLPVAACESTPVTLTSSDRAEGSHLLKISSWSVPDFAVAAALLAIVAGILFPTISHARYSSRLWACQQNLTQIGSALMQFSDSHCGMFVEIPRSGPLAASGSFAPILKECGYIENDNVFACAGVADEKPVHIPSVDVLLNAKGEHLCQMRRRSSGHFGYTMGHCEGEQYCPPRNLGRSHVVIVADMPSLALEGRRSANHCGKGQNCLFEDGHVQFVRGCSIGEDAIFVNDYNMVAPGVRSSDNVISPSHLSPAVYEFTVKDDPWSFLDR